ncbi:MAG: Cys regulon transcriptional activator CysB [uncultured Rubrobacteraceae bacterium]|uniref:Cys regulon transcriptional activator CysB n=1 Tax=uncultured Rubrobacteraceae bacterium TaxID=349277 RepID=A0A6J4RBK7_9ACTN|nr:MAG: Cys regulon transcriptional activator CysB [uncultured Rubrobacteraceae bacterium]
MLFGQLECFLAVARAGSMSRAAEEMFLAQPSLTARLKALEHEVGDQLFVRTRSGMRLTEAGRQFLPYAERAVTSVANGKQHLEELRKGTGGHLRLGALPRVSTYALPGFLEGFSLAHPGVVLSVKTGHSEDILEMVLSEEVQLGLARSMRHPEVESLPLYEEELVLAVGKGHAFAGRRDVGLAELGGERLILFDRASTSYELTKSLFRDAGVAGPDVVELDNIEAAKRMVEQGLGVAFLPEPAVLRAVAAGRLATVRIDACPKLGRTIVALRRKDVPLTGTAAAFMNLVGEMGQGPGRVPDQAR